MYIEDEESKVDKYSQKGWGTLETRTNVDKNDD